MKSNSDLLARCGGDEVVAMAVAVRNQEVQCQGVRIQAPRIQFTGYGFFGTKIYGSRDEDQTPLQLRNLLISSNGSKIQQRSFVDKHQIG